MIAHLSYCGRVYVVTVVPSTEYMWTDGNYSCDCNRSLFIEDVCPAFPSMKCGDSIVLEALEGNDDDYPR